MPIIDPHHHLWDLEQGRHPWLTGPVQESIVGDPTPLRRSYRPRDYLEDAQNQDLAKSVHVQAEYDAADPAGETRWLQSLADTPRSRGFPHGIVAFANFADPGVEQLLEQHCQYRNMRGIRHLLNRHPNPVYNYTDRDYLQDETWCRNFGLLRKLNLSYDLQIYYPQMPGAVALAQRYPDIQIILNHTGMPLDRSADGIVGWRNGMAALAECPNIAVKISGLGMVDHDWTVQSIRPFVLTTLATFDVERCMFASNFPVDKLFSSYDKIWNAFQTLTAQFSQDERRALFHDNAARFYRL